MPNCLTVPAVADIQNSPDRQDPAAQIDSSALLTLAVDWQFEVATASDLAVRVTPEPGGDSK